ncbi:hypothetical protein [Hyphomicrobium sp.]|uniref:hypothetical protein n=1 Tax=Hyphomicrobium sp. TaxID=82 RepID=UPI002FE18BA0
MMDLDAIAAAFGVRLHERIKRAVISGGITDPNDGYAATLEALGVTDAAIRRAVFAAARDFDIGENLRMLFCIPYAMGDGAALGRAKLAVSDPRAKGREVAVLDALIAGADIEDALRRPVSPDGASSGAVVVPFRTNPA